MSFYCMCNVFVCFTSDSLLAFWHSFLLVWWVPYIKISTESLLLQQAFHIQVIHLLLYNLLETTLWLLANNKGFFGVYLLIELLLWKRVQHCSKQIVLIQREKFLRNLIAWQLINYQNIWVIYFCFRFLVCFFACFGFEFLLLDLFVLLFAWFRQWWRFGRFF